MHGARRDSVRDSERIGELCRCCFRRRGTGKGFFTIEQGRFWEEEGAVRIVLANGQIVDPGSGIYGHRDLLISGGRIRAVVPSLAPFRQWLEDGPGDLWVYDLTGFYLFPGLIDIHTHLRVPGQEYKEDLVSGTLAAAWGGFTTVLTMPNTNPCVDRVSVLATLRKRIHEEARVRVGIVGAVSRGQAGRQLAPLAAMRRSGAVAFSDDGRPLVHAGLMKQALETSRELSCPVISHCEEPTLVRGGVICEGEVSRRMGLPGIPASAEQVMVARDLWLARETGGRLHLAHLSTAGSVEMVRVAKEKGVSVTAEVTPHHLALTDRAVLRFGADAKVNPPLCSWNDVSALRRGIRDGTVDAVASDHAPHHPDEKARGLARAPFGIIGMETALPVMMTLAAQGVVDVRRVVELLSWGPARIMGLEGGILAQGGAADLVVVDPDRTAVVDVRRFRSKARNSPFRGMKLSGWPVLTLKDGEVVMKRRSMDGRVQRLEQTRRGKE
jgi:dihydroorotase